MGCGCCYMTPPYPVPAAERRPGGLPGEVRGWLRGLAPARGSRLRPLAVPARSRRRTYGLGEGGRRGEKAGRAARGGGPGCPRAQPGSSGAGAAPARLLPSLLCLLLLLLLQRFLLTSRDPASAHVPGRPPSPGARSPALAAEPGSARLRRRAPGAPRGLPPEPPKLRLERGRGGLGAICWPLGRTAG